MTIENNSLREVLARLARIEERLGIVADSSVSAGTNLSSGVATIAQPSPVAGPPAEGQFQKPFRGPNPYTAARRAPLKSSGRMLGAIAVICFVLSAIFLIQLVIDTGWLTPLRQFALSILFGAGLIASGLILQRQDRFYSGYLAAAGIVVLYLSVYAGFLYFGILTEPATLVGVGVLAFYSISLRERFESELFSVTAAVGVSFGPLVLGKFLGQLEIVLAYYTIWSIVFSQISARIQTRVLPLVAAYSTFGALGIISIWTRNETQILILAWTQALQFLIYASGVAWYSVRNRLALSSAEAAAYFPLLLFFYFTEYSMIYRLAPEAAPWISMGFAALLILIYFSARKRLQGEHLASSDLVAGFAFVVLAHSGYFALLPTLAKPWLMCFLIALSLIPAVQSRTSVGAAGTLSRVVAGGIVIIEVLRVVYHLFSGNDLYWGLLGGLTGLLLILVHLVKSEAERSESREGLYVILGAAHLILVLTFHQLFRDAGSLVVSIVWGGYAIVILLWALHRRDALFARSSMIVLLFAVGKVFFHDLDNVNTVTRVATFACTGVALYMAGFIFRKTEDFS